VLPHSRDGGRRPVRRLRRDQYPLTNSAVIDHCPLGSGSKRVNFNEKASSYCSGREYYQSSARCRVNFRTRLGQFKMKLCRLADQFGMEMCHVAKHSSKKSGYDRRRSAVLHTVEIRIAKLMHVHLLIPVKTAGRGSIGKKSNAPRAARTRMRYHLNRTERIDKPVSQAKRSAMKRLRSSGKLSWRASFESLGEDDNWRAFIKDLESKDVVRIKQPATDADYEKRCSHEVVNT